MVETPEPDPILLGILALLVAEREDEPKAATEVVLARAGLSHQLIADLVGKKPEAVRKRIERAKSDKAKPKAGKNAKSRKAEG
jgi:hypothetical protein